MILTEQGFEPVTLKSQQLIMYNLFTSGAIVFATIPSIWHWLEYIPALLLDTM